ncbi:Protein kinase wis1 [Zalerion maritima]|uniref:mitogen-activated protein kinase kinase n=1 Tax=Zalerion maritima TaxID=339359 RepID=A0AAD5RXM8_9PEZI|nr:Protein kinase wis1 [Zalerion maritima]
MGAMVDPNSIPPTPEEKLDHEAPQSPMSPTSANSSEASTPLEPTNSTSPSEIPKRVPSLRSVSDPSNSNPMNPTSTPTGVLNQARAPPAAATPDLLAKAREFQLQRMNINRAPGSTGSIESTPVSRSPIGAGSPAGGFPPGRQMPGLPGMPNMTARPMAGGVMRSDSAVPMAKGGSGLARRRRIKLDNMSGNPVTALNNGPPGGMKLPEANGGSRPALNGAGQGTRLSDFDKYIDSQKGWITFDGAATITKEGVNFANGSSFQISLDEIEVLDELGKGNYGTVYKVRHAKPHVPRFGPGLTGFRKGQAMKAPSFMGSNPSQSVPNLAAEGGTGKVMAMKEIRLELDESKFTTILKELVILHACTSPFIIDFYGAFFQEGAVYMCIEYMDGGSVDQLYSGGIPESVLRKITYATVVGLRYLKEKHNIIHRDVKPTNVLVNTRGQVKICDFGVSGNLVASLAKTNIGCQSYMAPERITQGNGTFSAMGVGESTYSVSSDIWSLGLSVIECATGKYPYPPEVSSSILGQLNAIVDGEPPALPDVYSSTAKDFVQSCLHKIPAMRPSYTNLVQHPWLAPLSKPDTITEEDEEAAEREDITQGVENMKLAGNACSVDTGDPEVAEWVKNSLAKKLAKKDEAKNPMSPGAQPALHKVPLDRASPSASLVKF